MIHTSAKAFEGSNSKLSRTRWYNF